LQNDNRLATWRYDPIVPLAPPKSAPGVEMITQIMFEKGQPLAGKSVSSSLFSVAAIIERAIEAFAS
jgi:hypothetical protein